MDDESGESVEPVERKNIFFKILRGFPSIGSVVLTQYRLVAD